MENEYGGNWITTFTGKQFHFLRPKPDEIDIADIAHALSLTCRFGGQCREFYSVADHSIRVADIVPAEHKLLALLHDAAEAYMPDLPRPEKAQVPKFKEMEGRILLAILDKFVTAGKVFWESNLEVVKHADDVMLATEARDLMANMKDWAKLPDPLSVRIEPMTARESELLFTARFRKYSIQL